MKKGEDVLIETIDYDCPFCDKVHPIEIHKRQTKGLIKEEIVDFKQIYYLCSITDFEEGNEFVPAGIMDESLNQARNAYRIKRGLPTSKSKYI